MVGSMSITPINSANLTALTAAERMDKQYRYQRYVYDGSRKYYLWGRDTLLNEISLEPQDTLLEIGCGTGRNLFQLHERYPQHALYGVDASQLMLEQAQRRLTPQSASTIHFKQGLAQELTLEQLGVQQAFDHIVFSYVLSMIPEWRLAFDHALTLLKPSGTLHLVDFADQSALPRWMQAALKQWLAWFQVHPDVQVPDYLQTVSLQSQGQLQMRYLWGRYALLAHYSPRSTCL